MKGKTRRFLLWILPGAAIFLLDRLFKVLFNDGKWPVLPGVIGLKSAKNTGMALGMLSGNALPLLIFSIIIVVICILILRKYRITGFARIALSMMAGGALGNALDRLVYGYVIDMIELQFIDFYIFNLADVGVVCGAILCGISLLFRPQDWSNK